MDWLTGWQFPVFAALAVVVYGLYMYISRDPVAFSSKEKGLKSFQLTDVKAWNRKHGMMIMIYGALLLIGAGLEQLLIRNGSGLSELPLLAAVIVPIPVIMKLHKKYVAEYIKN